LYGARNFFRQPFLRQIMGGAELLDPLSKSELLAHSCLV
jgi:hypothetical protein